MRERRGKGGKELCGVSISTLEKEWRNLIFISTEYTIQPVVIYLHRVIYEK